VLKNRANLEHFFATYRSTTAFVDITEFRGKTMPHIQINKDMEKRKRGKIEKRKTGSEAKN